MPQIKKKFKIVAPMVLPRTVYALKDEWNMITGIDKNKMSRLLTGSQEESGTDMEKIASGLGNSVEFFLADAIVIPQIGNDRY